MLRAFHIKGCRAGLRRRAWCRFCYWLYVNSGIPVQWLPIGEMLSSAGCVAYASDREEDGHVGCLICNPRPKEAHDE